MTDDYPTESNTAAELLPARRSLKGLIDAAEDCRACPLWRDATQTVFGEGRVKSTLMLVGEKPGDKEDRAGYPFVGPAGGLLDRALEEARIDRDETYVTNVVKHFKFIRQGKRRLHKRPNAEEIAACRPWLEAEIEVVEPKVVMALGATAAKALLGSDFRVTKDRGELRESDRGPLMTGTVHPSSILRAPDDEARHAAYDEFVEDLRRVRKRLEE